MADRRGELYDLSLPRAALERVIPQLVEAPDAVAAGPAGLLRSNTECELLGRELTRLPRHGGGWGDRPEDGRGYAAHLPR